MESQLAPIEQSLNARYSLWVREDLDELHYNFTITDPNITGHPIVFASPGFLKMSGFSREQVVGNNGRIFQGPKTNRKTVMEIREAIREERAVRVRLLNYRKDGTPFWMLFQMSPVFSKEDGGVVHFIGVQVPIRRNKKLTDAGADAACNEIAFGSCRREVCSDSLVELTRVLALDTDTNCKGLFLCNSIQFYEGDFPQFWSVSLVFVQFISVLWRWFSTVFVCESCFLDFKALHCLGSIVSFSFAVTAILINNHRSYFLPCNILVQVT